MATFCVAGAGFRVGCIRAPGTTEGAKGLRPGTPSSLPLLSDFSLSSSSTTSNLDLAEDNNEESYQNSFEASGLRDTDA